MNRETLRLMFALHEQLRQHPEDRQTLEVYGRLPSHLMDAIADHSTEAGTGCNTTCNAAA